MNGIRYVHTNIIARDWRRLVAFYVEVFGCRVVPPERDLSGEWLQELTGIAGAHIVGAHLSLPGYGDGGPTLEIFSYAPELLRSGPNAINRQGLGHTAFLVDDVASMVERIEDHGGAILESIVTRSYDQLGTLTVAYCQDPEDNFIEVQNWHD